MNLTVPAGRRRRLAGKVVLRTSIAIGVLIAAVAVAGSLFLEPIVNGLIKPGLVKMFAEAFPERTIHLGAIRIGLVGDYVACDSIAITGRGDSSSITATHVTVHGIDWWAAAWRWSFAHEDFARSSLDLCNLAVTFPGSVYELRCDTLQLSIADSGITVTGLTVQPPGTDEQVFASRPVRMTRLRMVLPRGGASGVAWLDLIQGRAYRARSIRMDEAGFDILINKDKPPSRSPTRPMNPGELFASLGATLQVDSLTISNGRVRYAERMLSGSRPGVIAFDSVQVSAECIANTVERGDAITVHASGQFMSAGLMKVDMVIPIASPEFSYRYAGSLGRMDLASLNGFLESAEQLRITHGVLRVATFKIDVESGRATGTVEALYQGLVVAMIDKHTGSAGGIMDGIASFIANKFKLRGTNLADGSGKATVGDVRYVHRREEAFMEFTWFALRSGLGDVVGF